MNTTGITTTETIMVPFGTVEKKKKTPKEKKPKSGKPKNTDDQVADLTTLAVLATQGLASSPEERIDVVIEPPLKRYSDSELAEFETNIMNKIEKADNEIKFFKESLSKLDPHDKDSMRGKPDILTQLGREIELRKNLQGALDRVHTKAYGICRKTGALIDRKRLMVNPHTTICIAAKMKDANAKKH